MTHTVAYFTFFLLMQIVSVPSWSINVAECLLENIRLFLRFWEVWWLDNICSPIQDEKELQTGFTGHVRVRDHGISSRKSALATSTSCHYDNGTWFCCGPCWSHNKKFCQDQKPHFCCFWGQVLDKDCDLQHYRKVRLMRTHMIIRNWMQKRRSKPWTWSPLLPPMLNKTAMSVPGILRLSMGFNMGPLTTSCMTGLGEKVD